MKKAYRVTFDTQKNRIYRNWAIDVEANNLKEAKEIAKSMWESSSHMFHVDAKRLKPEEEFLYHWFKVLSWKSVTWGRR